jgi:hypothetical protein
MHYLNARAIALPNDRTSVFLQSKDDLDRIESPLRFMTTDGEQTSYFVITADVIYEYPYPEDATDLFGSTLLERARALASSFIATHPTKSRVQDFEIEEYLRTADNEPDPEVCKLTERMINATLAERPIEPGEELVDLQAEKAYMSILSTAAEAIAKLPEYRTASGEMPKTMVIKRYIAEHDVPIRNKNAPNEIKALIQAYYPQTS